MIHTSIDLARAGHCTTDFTVVVASREEALP